MSIALSVVVHGHRQFVIDLLEDLQNNVGSVDEVWLTANTEADSVFLSDLQASFKFNLIVNPSPKGFGANHNAAFLRTSSTYFVVCNPDIRFGADPFPALVTALSNDPRLQVLSPVVVSPEGQAEDHARDFLFPTALLRRFVERARPAAAEPATPKSDNLYPDWLGGMLHLYRSRDFKAVGGFDEGYFLYVEDMDLCWRFRRSGGVCRVIDTAPTVTHAAQRMSRRSFQHIRWHFAGLIRFWLRAAFRVARIPAMKVRTVVANNAGEQPVEA